MTQRGREIRTHIATPIEWEPTVPKGKDQSCAWLSGKEPKTGVIRAHLPAPRPHRLLFPVAVDLTSDPRLFPYWRLWVNSLSGPCRKVSPSWPTSEDTVKADGAEADGALRHCPWAVHSSGPSLSFSRSYNWGTALSPGSRELRTMSEPWLLFRLQSLLNFAVYSSLPGQ